jgi:hypothetical protein
MVSGPRIGIQMKGVAILSILIAMSLASCGPAGNQAETVDGSNGCQIDAARICHDMRKTPFFGSAQGTIRELIVPISIPLGPNIDVHCGINTADQSVAYVRVVQPPSLTTDDLISLRSRGYCI